MKSHQLAEQLLDAPVRQAIAIRDSNFSFAEFAGFVFLGWCVVTTLHGFVDLFTY